jgi:hypothetical protein
MKNLVNQNLDEFLFESRRSGRKKAKSKGQSKFEKVLHHWKQGKQHIGRSKKFVPKTEKGQKQALAIAFSEKRKAEGE